MAAQLIMQTVQEEIRRTLQEKIIPFWLNRSVDKYGGYLTAFDGEGNFTGDGEKYITTQSRMLWGFSHLASYARSADRDAIAAAAHHGFRFLEEHFWDQEMGGFYWRVDRSGAVLDPAKLVYGQSFAIYALSEYYLQFHRQEALCLAEKTFERIQLYAADTRFGGYYENLERDWRRTPFGQGAGDRKSLDIHMHLMEAFTTLYQASGKEIHCRKLEEVLQLILDRMVNRDEGYGCNQFSPDFRRIPAINIPRTWNAERAVNEQIADPTDSTSYGHNVELSWLLDQAFQLLGTDGGAYAPVLWRLLDHSLRHGYDGQFGGLYRDGVGGQVLVKDKEWWQNFEALAGYLNGYVKYGRQEYWNAFEGTWNFVRDHFMNDQIGESRQLLNREGRPIIPDLGNPWKGIYHTGRALAECLDRFEKLV